MTSAGRWFARSATRSPRPAASMRSINSTVSDANLGLERGDATRRERLLDEPPQARVIGGLARREPGCVVEPGLVEDALDLGAVARR